MTEVNKLKTIKFILNDYSKEYKQIVNTFEKFTMGTESMEENKKMGIRMKALEVRCKDSQFLLKRIITSLNSNGKGFAKIEKYENQVRQLLSDIRGTLDENNLMEMIKYLEKIPTVMSAIDNEIDTELKKSSD